MSVAPQPPAVADEMFLNGRLPLAVHYAELLVTAGIERGLIGPRESDRIWDRHILNCGLLADILPTRGEGVDIGSGAGLPGIPVAIARPEIQLTLVEPLFRRVVFLNEVIQELELDNVFVVRGRAEDKSIQRRVGKVDFVTSRAVAPLAKLSDWSAPFVSSGGFFLALKGSTAAEELERDKEQFRAAGWRSEEVVQLHRDGGVEDTFVVRARHI